MIHLHRATPCNLLRFRVSATSRVLAITERSQDNRGNCEYFLGELLLHVDLLGMTVQFLHEIGNMSSLDYQDKTKWKELESVYSEVERQFVCLFNHGYYESTRSTLTCQQQSQTVETKRPGRPSYNIPKEVLVELRGLNFSWCKISHNVWSVQVDCYAPDPRIWTF